MSWYPAGILVPLVFIITVERENKVYLVISLGLILSQSWTGGRSSVPNTLVGWNLTLASPQGWHNSLIKILRRPKASLRTKTLQLNILKTSLLILHIGDSSWHNGQCLGLKFLLGSICISPSFSYKIWNKSCPRRPCCNALVCPGRQTMVRALRALTFVGNDRMLSTLAPRHICLQLHESPPAQAWEEPRKNRRSLHGGQRAVDSGHVSPNQKLVLPSCEERAWNTTREKPMSINKCLLLVSLI